MHFTCLTGKIGSFEAARCYRVHRRSYQQVFMNFKFHNMKHERARSSRVCHRENPCFPDESDVCFLLDPTSDWARRKRKPKAEPAAFRSTPSPRNRLCNNSFDFLIVLLPWRGS